MLVVDFSAKIAEPSIKDDEAKRTSRHNDLGDRRVKMRRYNHMGSGSQKARRGRGEELGYLVVIVEKPDGRFRYQYRTGRT